MGFVLTGDAKGGSHQEKDREQRWSSIDGRVDIFDATAARRGRLTFSESMGAMTRPCRARLNTRVPLLDFPVKRSSNQREIQKFPPPGFGKHSTQAAA
jgi:hypothetical protein